MDDILKISLAALSQDDYKRDIAELAGAIERGDVAALQQRKENSFGAALHERVCGPSKSIRTNPA